MIFKKLSFILFISPLIVVSCANPIISHNNEKNDPPIKNEDLDLEIENADQFFPKINANDYLEFIEFNNNHEPIITNELKLSFLKSVLKKVSTNRGQIQFWEQKVSEQKTIFYFKWTYKEKKFYKSYVIDLLNSLN